MAHGVTIARPYAQAAFRFASQENTLSNWSSCLAVLAQISNDKLVRKSLNNPLISKEQWVELFCSVGKIVSSAQRNFLTVLSGNKRLFLLPHISKQFDMMKNEYDGVIVAEVCSPFSLSQEEADTISSLLNSKYSRTIKLNVQLMPDLIGGISVRVGDSVYDFSVCGSLATLEKTLKN